MLTRAEREGWITREISEMNHRILTASLTRKGEAALQRGLATAAEIEEKIWTGVSANTLDPLNTHAEHGIANLRGEIEAPIAQQAEFRPGRYSLQISSSRS